jgi:hypothetical protein
MPTEQLFPTSGRVEEQRQIGRGGAIDRLQGRVERGQHALLFGERRIGKSSVSAAVVARIQAAGGIGIDIDLSAGIGDERGLVATLLTQARDQQIGRATKGVGRTQAVRRRVERIRSAVGLMEALGIDESAELDQVLAAVSMEEGFIDLRRILAAIHADALICERPVVILIDEIQHLLGWRNTDAVQHELARTMRSSRGPSFVFAGSERRPIEQLFAPGGPLHREGLIFTLPEIADGDWEIGLVARFAQGGITIDAHMVRAILAISDGHPQDTMRLCEHVYEWALASATRTVDENVLSRARAEAIRHPSWGDR